MFLSGNGSPKAISSTTLVLIPKVCDVSSFDQLRPISLCRFIHKLISKILNKRFRPLLDKIISPEQCGFFPERNIHTCIALAHDLTSHINRKVYEGDIVIKLDMAKAYDFFS